MSDPYAEIAERIRSIIEDLDAAMFDDLREAAARHEGRPEADRRAARARRSLEKAAQLLDRNI